jgi:hypothetical protein
MYTMDDITHDTCVAPLVDDCITVIVVVLTIPLLLQQTIEDGSGGLSDSHGGQWVDDSIAK